MNTRRRRHWPKGTWMRLQSPDLLRSLMEDERRNFSMARLARYAGCSKSFISHLTSGRKKTCTPELAERIAEALSVPVELLFVPSSSADSGQTSRTMRKERAA